MEKFEGHIDREHEADVVSLTKAQRALIESVALDMETKLRKNHYPGFGIFPSAEPGDNFYNQVYARDSAHAIGNYYADTNLAAVRDSLATLLRYQRADGALPLRVEREHQMVKLMPGLRRFSKQIFSVMEGRMRGRIERPVYEGGDFGVSGSEDTVPVILIAVGEFFRSSPEGREFAKERFEKLNKAVAFFEGKTDAEDGLVVVVRKNADWVDSLHRPGKLGGMNVLWARALQFMEIMARELGYEDDARRYREEFVNVNRSIREKLYNAREGYFRAEEGEDRVDTVASIFGSLYLLTPQEAVSVEETLKVRVLRSSGLQNFHPFYTGKAFSWVHRTWGGVARGIGKVAGVPKHGLDAYHTRFVWPWVTCQNIRVKIKIAREHPDRATRNRYKREAVQDLFRMSEIFQKIGGAYEALDPDEIKPAEIFGYTTPRNFLGSMVAYQGAYRQLRKLEWI